MPQGQNTKTWKKKYCNKFNKDLKKWSTSKRKKKKNNFKQTKDKDRQPVALCILQLVKNPPAMQETPG